MDSKRLADDLPGNVRVVIGARGVLAVREDWAEALLSAGYGPDDEPRPEVADAVGKRPLGVVRSGAQTLLVRRFQHGGLLRWLTGTCFASPARPFAEWRLQARLEALGIATPAVVAARAARRGLLGWELDLATERVTAALDLGLLLARRRDGQIAQAAWRNLLAATGRFVAELHEAGFEHADLTPRNLLADLDSLESPAPRLWVLDLDGSRFADGPLAGARRAANLARLDRHLLRMQREHGSGLSHCDRWRFLRAYAPERPTRLRLARGLRRRGAGLHALGWLLERRWGRGRGTAESHLGRDSAHR